MDKNSLAASKIKEIRIEKNILQKQVAKAIGLGENAYSRIEGGFTQITVNNLFKIAETLETTVDNILSLKNSKISNNSNNVVMSQFNECTVNVHLTAKEFTELYNMIKSKK